MCCLKLLKMNPKWTIKILIGTIFFLYLGLNQPAVGEEITKKEVSPDEPFRETGHRQFENLDDLMTMYQPYINNIRAYQPMYFLLGTALEKSKFQFSFKYRFFNPNGNWAKRHPWIKGFHLAYTQTSFWDLASESIPFQDSSYKPEIFLLTSNVFPWFQSINRLFIQTGVQHESNGRGDTDSRSTNFLYIEPIFVYYHASTKLGIQVAPRVWTYVFNTNDTNPDLSDYRGFWKISTKLGKADSFVFDVNFRNAKKGTSLEIDFTYPLNKYLINNIELYLHIQYSDMLAENLLEYSERSHALRIGFAVVR